MTPSKNQFFQLKNRAAKLEKSIAWKWFEDVLGFQDNLSAEILYLLVELEVLKQPLGEVWKLIEQGRNRALLEEVREEDFHVPEDFSDDTSTLVTLLTYAFYMNAPNECRAKGGEDRLIDMSRRWLSEVRPDVAEWPNADIREMLRKGTDACVGAESASAASLQFIQAYRA